MSKHHVLYVCFLIRSKIREVLEFLTQYYVCLQYFTMEKLNSYMPNETYVSRKINHIFSNVQVRGTA